jgi:hypothetical protein
MMQVFPFSNEDWTRVKEVSIELTNAALVEDSSLNTFCYLRFDSSS